MLDIQSIKKLSEQKRHKEAVSQASKLLKSILNIFLSWRVMDLCLLMPVNLQKPRKFIFNC